MPEINCDATSLLAASECYDQLIIRAGRGPAVMVYLLNVATGLNLTPNQLIALAECIDKTIPAGMMQAVITALLCQTANGQIMNSNLLASGIAQLAGGTTTVSNPNALATNVILLTYFSATTNSTIIGYNNVVDGVSFDINSSDGGDTGMVSWAILKP